MAASGWESHLRNEAEKSRRANAWGGQETLSAPFLYQKQINQPQLTTDHSFSGNHLIILSFSLYLIDANSPFSSSTPLQSSW